MSSQTRRHLFGVGPHHRLAQRLTATVTLSWSPQIAHKNSARMTTREPGKSVSGYIGSLDGTAIAPGFHASTRLTTSPVTVPFTLTDVESNGIRTVELQYSYGGIECLGLDCNDGDPAIRPGLADAICDGVDTNCDGALDEEYVPDESCGQGYCLSNNTPSSCSAGIESPCAEGTAFETPERTCFDGVDNDCDGQSDALDADCTGVCSDVDFDTVCDGADNCVNTANTNQLDTDSNGEGNACDTDDDGDGTPDVSDPCPVADTNGPLTVPVASIGPDQASAELAVVGLDGSLSCFVAGSQSYSWRQISGPTVQVDNLDVPRLAFLTPRVVTDTVIQFELIVTDDSVPTVVAIVVGNTVNEAPVANAGVDQFVRSADVVTLNATASADPNGDTLEFFWSQIAGPAGRRLHEIAMTATNTLGTAEQQFRVSVFAAPLIVSSHNPSFLIGTAYRYDSDGLPEALGSSPLTWSLLVSPEGMFVNASTGEVVWTPPSASPASVTLEVSNAYGADQQSFTINRDGPTEPHISTTANAAATVNMPHRYDADNFVDVIGTLPGELLRLEVLTAPEGFIVHPTSREVGWVPSSLGSMDIGLGLVTADDVLLDRYEFTVIVGSDASAQLQAVAEATPTDGAAPLSVVFDASASQGTDGLPILQYVWDTQSGPVLRSDTDTLEGEGVLTVQFGCDCNDPDGDITSTLWQFGDGDTSIEANPEHRYGRPGSYTVRLTVEDDQGLLAYDSVTAVVRSDNLYAPVARIETTSIDGNGPVVLEFHADTEDRERGARRRRPSGSTAERRHQRLRL